jgi:2-hydroxy-3-keto-5-methylthiopentenyl-1-phosphate phosphatase
MRIQPIWAPEQRWAQLRAHGDVPQTVGGKAPITRSHSWNKRQQRKLNGGSYQLMKDSTQKIKTLIQCDFDGTITQEDESFLLLDAFADGNWRQLLSEYREGRISVGDFNTRAFAMVKADKQTLADFTRRTVQIRDGFDKLVSHCRKKGFKLVIVSNGLDFYIKATLQYIGMDNITVFAAQTRFASSGLDVKYIGPDGSRLQDGFKEAYTKSFLADGYRIIYFGNGPSDMSPAKLAHRTFATGELLALCKKTRFQCTSFTDFSVAIRDLEL